MQTITKHNSADTLRKDEYLCNVCICDSCSKEFLLGRHCICGKSRHPSLRKEKTVLTRRTRLD